MELSPLKDWLSADEAIAAIVGDRVVVGSLDPAQFPAVQISDLTDDIETRVVVQFNGWVGGENAKSRAKELQTALVARLQTIPPAICSQAAIVRNNLVGIPREQKRVDYRVGIDVVMAGVQ